MTSTTVQRFVANQPKVRPARDPEVRRYGEGCDAGRNAALDVFQAPHQFGGTWQHPALDRIPDTDHELRGWLVGYLCALQRLSTLDKHH